VEAVTASRRTPNHAEVVAQGVDERAARELAKIKARIKAGRRPITAVEALCRPRQHVQMSIHPLRGEQFLVWRRGGGKAIGRDRDSDQWQRDGAAEPGLDEAGFGPLDEDALVVSGLDADSPRDLLGVDWPVIACECRWVTVDSALADRIHAALTDWRTESRAGSRRPIREIVD
jgi:hypothetical protein